MIKTKFQMQCSCSVCGHIWEQLTSLVGEITCPACGRDKQGSETWRKEFSENPVRQQNPFKPFKDYEDEYKKMENVCLFDSKGHEWGNFIANEKQEKCYKCGIVRDKKESSTKEPETRCVHEWEETISPTIGKFNWCPKCKKVDFLDTPKSEPKKGKLNA